MGGKNFARGQGGAWGAKTKVAAGALAGMALVLGVHSTIQRARTNAILDRMPASVAEQFRRKGVYTGYSEEQRQFGKAALAGRVTTGQYPALQWRARQSGYQPKEPHGTITTVTGGIGTNHIIEGPSGKLIIDPAWINEMSRARGNLSTYDPAQRAAGVRYMRLINESAGNDTIAAILRQTREGRTPANLHQYLREIGAEQRASKGPGIMGRIEEKQRSREFFAQAGERRRR